MAVGAGVACGAGAAALGAAALGAAAFGAAAFGAETFGAGALVTAGAVAEVASFLLGHKLDRVSFPPLAKWRAFLRSATNPLTILSRSTPEVTARGGGAFFKAGKPPASLV